MPRKKKTSFQINKLIVPVLIFLLVFSIIKNHIIKVAIENIGSDIVGAEIQIDRFSLGFVSQAVSIKGFKIQNPPGFPEEYLINVPEVTIKANLLALLIGKIHLKKIVVNVHELVVIKSKDNQMNVDALKVSTEDASQDESNQATNQSQQKLSLQKFQIDLLKLNVDRVVYKDYSLGPEPTIKVYDIGLRDKVIKDITSVEELAVSVLVQAMGPTAIRSVGLYAAATLMGVGFLPAGVLGLVVAKDDATGIFYNSYRHIFNDCVDYVEQVGTLKKKQLDKGMISAKIDGYDVKFQIKEIKRKKTEVVINVRKFMLPKPEIAGGILYKLEKFIN